MPAKTEKKECVWSNNHLACVNTWAFLRSLDQLKALFDDAKDVKMSELVFWNPTASPEMRRMQAMSLAAQLDKMFIIALRARYEDGFNVTKAVETMTSELIKEDNTVCNFAVTVDDVYAFVGEVK